jgi:hypothetical protein
MNRADTKLIHLLSVEIQLATKQIFGFPLEIWYFIVNMVLIAVVAYE